MYKLAKLNVLKERCGVNLGSLCVLLLCSGWETEDDEVSDGRMRAGKVQAFKRRLYRMIVII